MNSPTNLLLSAASGNRTIKGMNGYHANGNGIIDRINGHGLNFPVELLKPWRNILHENDAAFIEQAGQTSPGRTAS